MTHKKLKEVILAKVQEHKDYGGKFCDEVYYDAMSGARCIVGIFLPKHDGFNECEERVAAKIGCTKEQIESVEIGFCAWDSVPKHQSLYQFGNQLRSTLI